MKAVAVLCVIAAFLSVSVAQNTYAGVAVLRQIGDPLSGVSGVVTFQQSVPNGNVTVSVVANVPGKANAQIGIHVHTFGDQNDTTRGLSAGGHWDPMMSPHSCPENTSVRHYGDMGNWDIDANGNINMTKTLDLLSLTGEYSIIGRSVVVHADKDNCLNVSSSGNRLAFGVIGIANLPNNQASSGASYTDVRVLVCDLVPTNWSTIYGRVVFNQPEMTAPTVVTANANITEARGFHVHTFGDLRDRAGMSVAGHYDPTNVGIHAIPDVVPRHAGDMGSITFMDGQVGWYIHTFQSYIKTSGNNNIIGRAVIIHQRADDCSQPVGNAGNRYAYCVIGIANSTSVTDLPVPAGTPRLQNTTLCPASPEPTQNSAMHAVAISLQFVAVLIAALLLVINNTF